MGTDTEISIKLMPIVRAYGTVYRIQTPKARKLQVNHFFKLPVDCVYAFDTLLIRHFMPFLMQLNTICMLHDDVFAANGIIDARGIVTPVKNSGYRNCSIGLH